MDWNIIKNKMKYISISLIILSASCNGQHEKNKKMNRQTNEKISSFNIFNDGGMNINFEKFITDNKERIRSEVNKYGYKVPDTNTFYDKIKFYYNWDIKDYTNIIVLENDMFPVVIKDYNLIYVENSDGEEIDGQLISNYNKFIFYDDNPALAWLKLRHPYLLDDLVSVYGFTENNDILKFVFSRTNFESKSVLIELLFQDHETKLKLREKMVKKLREIKFNNEISTDYGVVVGADVYSNFSDLIQEIRKKPNDFQKSDYQIAFLLNEIILSGIRGIVDEDLDENPDYIKVLQNNNYYGFERLKNYLEHEYSNSLSYNSKYKINDSDGYTNLRKEKNTSSEILQKISTGSEVQVLDNSGDWWLVQTKEGKKGYVYKTKIKAESFQ
ncbi:SH3 domain-containing protein [Flavobacterium anhuiense]|nr:SH3 domain-containing protein [Flavobacterium anhuiense]